MSAPTEKHRETAHLIFSRLMTRFGVNDAALNSIGLSEYEIAQALANAHREGMKRAAEIVRDSQFKIGGIDANNIAAAILAEAGDA